MTTDREIPEGVYYKIEDYGSLLRRLAAISLDTIVLSLLIIFIAWIWSFFYESPDLEMVYDYGWLSMLFFNPDFFLVCTLLAYIYLVIIKMTDLRTIGYRFANLKIVDLKGNRPSVLKMTWRFILLVFGPLSLIIDLFWLGGDDYRQTIRDKFAGTYVIKTNSVPLGSGMIIHSNYHFMGWSLIFREVKRDKKINRE